MYRSVCSPNKTVLVISQTCDLVQGKIKNDQVLCLEGTLSPVDVSTEAGLLKISIEQVQRAHPVYKVGAEFYSIDWAGFKNLRTFNTGTLNERRQWSLIGRLNEFYALSIQESAIQELGRIGLPVTPHYVYYINKISIAIIHQGKGRVTECEIANGDVVGVIRPGKSAFDIHLAQHVRHEMANQISTLLMPAGMAGGMNNTASLISLLQNPELKGFMGSGDITTPSGIDFKNGVLIDANGNRSTEKVPALAKICAQLAPGPVENKTHIEITFQPLKFDA
jgi:hypothetical protein